MELFNIEPSGALSRLAVAPPATPSAAWPAVGRPDVALESVTEAVGDDSAHEPGAPTDHSEQSAHKHLGDM